MANTKVNEKLAAGTSTITKSSDAEAFAAYQAQIDALTAQRDKAIATKQQELYLNGLDSVYRKAGAGSYVNAVATNASKFDRFGIRYTMDNFIKAGLTFITRPQLNLSSLNLRQDRIMSLLDTYDNKTMAFAIRAYLDTYFCLGNMVRGGQPSFADMAFNVVSNPNFELVCNCPFIDYRSPWFTILQNNLSNFSGSPTDQIETFTDEGGFFGESQSFAIGSDSYKKPFDLQLEFINPIGGGVDAIFLYWMRYIKLITDGTMIMYPFHMDQCILNYTVSIYRFLMDPTMQYIKSWYKYTGCFPIARPGASIADYNKSDFFVENARKFSVGFRCGSGVVDENDPIVIKEFNMLATRYFPLFSVFQNIFGADNIDKAAQSAGLIRNSVEPDYNYMGIPYIIPTPNGPKLEVFRQENETAFSANSIAAVQKSAAEIETINTSYNNAIDALRVNYHALVHGNGLSVSGQLTTVL